MPKPRTNYDAIDYWARSILANEPAPAIEVNSIIVRNDTVFSFGSHYPMGVIRRDSRGRTKAVILNSDFYPSRGFANTPGDQWNVRSLAHAYVEESPREIEVKFQLLSAFSTNGKIQTRPRPDDPEPPAVTNPEVPRRYRAHDPGPEPVDDGEDCIDGERYGVSKFEKQLMWTNDMRERPNDAPEVFLDELPSARRDRVFSRARHVLAYIDSVLDGRELFWVKTWKTYWTEFGTESYRYPAPQGARYEQCPHCKAFQARHDRWHDAMHGARYGRHANGGWTGYQANLAKYGGWEGWLQAWRRDRDRVRKARSERAAWEERNHIRLDYVPTVNGVPRTDPDGYPLRKDEDAYWKLTRAAERMERRRQRDLERHARERRQVEQFKERMRRHRAEHPTFEQAAAIAAETLRELNISLQANDS